MNQPIKIYEIPKIVKQTFAVKENHIGSAVRKYLC